MELMEMFRVGFLPAFYAGMMIMLFSWGIVRIFNFFYDIIRTRG